MAARGRRQPFDIAELSILGLLEGLMAYPRVVRRADETAALAAREQPGRRGADRLLGLHPARRRSACGGAIPSLPLVKYVGPQVWASRPGRAKTLAAAVDHLLTIHAFDAPLFRGGGPDDDLRRQPGPGRGLHRRRSGRACARASAPGRTSRSCWSCPAAGRRRSRGVLPAVRGRRAPAQGRAARTCRSSSRSPPTVAEPVRERGRRLAGPRRT